MLDKMAERFERKAAAIRGDHHEKPHVVSDEAFFRQIGAKVQTNGD